MPQCTTCNAPIAFIRTPLGKRMPVNLGRKTITRVEPAPGAKRATIVTDDGETVAGFELPTDRAYSTKGVVSGFTPHWATCDDPDRHRQGRLF